MNETLVFPRIYTEAMEYLMERSNWEVESACRAMRLAYQMHDQLAIDLSLKQLEMAFERR